ncbi:MAG: hypothetical protein FJ312_09890 [SAR202 cluster bacterium]|nr:hypothetical protein [SAR202 cluster bacterium]
MTSPHSVYFVETRQQADAMLALPDSRRGAVSIVALNPPVHYWLERQGIAAKRPEDYYTEDDLEAFGFALLDVIEQVSTVVDEAILRHAEGFRAHDLKVGSLLWYELKLLINSVAVPFFITEKVIASEKPGRVFYFGTNPESVPSFLGYVEESPWSHAIPVVCNTMEVQCAEQISVGSQGHAKTMLQQASQGPKRRLPNQATGISAVGRLRSVLARVMSAQSWTTQSTPRNGHLPVLVTLSTGYSMKHVVDLLRESHEMEVVRLSPRTPAVVQSLVPTRKSNPLDAVVASSYKAQLTDVWESTRVDERLKRLLTFSGGSFAGVVEKRLGHVFSHVAPDMFRIAVQTEETVRRLRPAAMVATTMLYPERVAMHTARRLGIPTVVYLHGATGGVVLMETHGNFIKYHTDLLWSDWAFTFGEGDSQYYRRYYPDAAKPVSVGSAELDELRMRTVSNREKQEGRKSLGLDSDIPTIFYVPTSMDGHLRPIPARGRSPSLMFEIERAIADVCGQFSHFQFVFKLHAAHMESAIVEYIEDKGYSNCKVTRQPFRGILPLADTFITDFPSTAFLEMLTTDRPILFCGHELPQKFNPEKWHPSILPMWKERVLYAEQLDEFLEMLRDFLRKGDFTPVKSSDEMLRLFGTHLDDGRSAERAVTELKKIIQAHTQAQRNDVEGAKDAVAVTRPPKS